MLWTRGTGRSQQTSRTAESDKAIHGCCAWRRFCNVREEVRGAVHAGSLSETRASTARSSEGLAEWEEEEGMEG